MIDQVNRLAENLLSGGEGVFLPSVGSLFVERRSARRLSKRTIEPPARVVTFTSQERGVSLVEAIARAAGCDAARAGEVYDRWLADVRREHGIAIEGVGELKYKNFIPDEAFDKRLNPQGHAPVRIRSARRPDWIVWFGIAAAAAALVVAGYTYLPLNGAAPRTEPESLAATSPNAKTPIAEPVAEANSAVAAGPESAAAGEQPGAHAAGEQTAAPTPIQAPPQTTTGQSAQPASGPVPADPQQTVQSDASGASERAADRSDGAETPPRLVSGRRYVVLGVFSTVENAGRALREAVRKDPSLRGSVYRFGDKFLVSAFDAEDGAACARFVREHRGQFPDLWVYTAR